MYVSVLLMQQSEQNSIIFQAFLNLALLFANFDEDIYFNALRKLLETWVFIVSQVFFIVLFKP